MLRVPKSVARRVKSNRLNADEPKRLTNIIKPKALVGVP